MAPARRVLSTSLALSTALLACGGPQVTDVTFLAPAADSGRAYSGEIYMLADAERTYVVSESGQDELPARWVAADAGGRVLWTALERCPDFRAPPMLGATAAGIFCKRATEIVGIDPALGVERWRWAPGPPLYITAAAGDRLATSVANEVLAVLDLASGRLTRRFLTDGAVLEAVAETDAGPVAVLVTEDRPAARRLVIQPIDGEAPAGDATPEPLQPTWSRPFEAYSFDLRVPGDAVIGAPREGLQACYDLADGHLRWLDFLELRPPLAWGSEGGASWGVSADGASAWVGLVDPATRTVRWQRPWAYGSPPVSASATERYTLFAGQEGWALYRPSDGAALASGSVRPGESLRSLAASDGAVTWMVGGAGSRTLHHARLLAGHPASQEPALPARPSWLRPGLQLRYLFVLHRGQDTETGLMREPRSVGFALELRSLRGGVGFAWQAEDGRAGERFIPAQVLAEARAHSDAFRGDEGEVAPTKTSLWFGRAVLAELLAGGSVTWRDDSAGGAARLALEGWSHHRAQLMRPGADAPAILDLPTVVLRAEPVAESVAEPVAEPSAEAGVETGTELGVETGQSRYWIAPWADYPLIVRAERPGFAAFLVALIVPPPPAP